ncbi:hypothetical protein INR49_027931, partial [Caranx melampygus]
MGGHYHLQDCLITSLYFKLCIGLAADLQSSRSSHVAHCKHQNTLTHELFNHMTLFYLHHVDTENKTWSSFEDKLPKGFCYAAKKHTPSWTQLWIHPVYIHPQIHSLA